MDPESMDELLFSAFELSLGEETRERIKKQVSNYQYYDGKQHENEFGELVHASELERPEELDYDPTRISTNYFKALVDRKARWQMGGQHGIRVPRKQIDDLTEVTDPDYEPSDDQRKEDDRAANYEDLLYRLWKENKMRARLMQAARDRLIADRVVCKIVFNQRTGKLRWSWRPDTEYVPIYSDDDFEELIGCHFIKPTKVEVKGEEEDAIQLQTYRFIGEEVYIHEGIYLKETLELVKRIIPCPDTVKEEEACMKADASYNSPMKLFKDKLYMPMNLDFIPVVEFAVEELVGGRIGDGEIEHLREQNDVLNQMNEDAIDSLRFEMFPITAFLDVPEGTVDKVRIAPGASIEARGSVDGTGKPDIRKIESGFRWKEAFKDQYMRVKGAMHEISGLPQVVPQELNFGGLNTDALRILYHDIISDTEEHWLSWSYGLAELHEKSIRYLQARTEEDNFSYDKGIVESIDDYESEMQYILPLPDNRRELVELLSEEVSADLESVAGAMERLGVDNVQAKKQEIENEKIQQMRLEDTFIQMSQESKTGGLSSDSSFEISSDSDDLGVNQRVGNNGEVEQLCGNCGGTGRVVSEKSGKEISCPKCKGTGWFQIRKR